MHNRSWQRYAYAFRFHFTCTLIFGTETTKGNRKLVKPKQFSSPIQKTLMALLYSGKLGLCTWDVDIRIEAIEYTLSKKKLFYLLPLRVQIYKENSFIIFSVVKLRKNIIQIFKRDIVDWQQQRSLLS